MHVVDAVVLLHHLNLNQSDTVDACSMLDVLIKVKLGLNDHKLVLNAVRERLGNLVVERLHLHFEQEVQGDVLHVGRQWRCLKCHELGVNNHQVPAHL